MAKTKIEWATDVWNPVVGCSVVSAGCTHCYAMRQAARWRDAPTSVYRGLTRQRPGKGAAWTGEVRMAPDATLTAPLRWRKASRVFVNSMGDLFHENVPDDWIDRVFAVMALAPQHLFMVLTKRPERMRTYFTHDEGFGRWGYIEGRARQIAPPRLAKVIHGRPLACYAGGNLPNVWLGVSIEDQETADERLPHLLATPAAGRFVSAEPLLGPVDNLLRQTPAWPDAPPLAELNLVICGGESGPGARPMHPDWARSLRDQCADAEVPFHFKQWGDWGPWEQSPEAAANVHRRVRFCNVDSHTGAVDRNNCDRINGALRIGKARAGRLLDGRTHDDVPPLPGEAA